MRNDYSFNCKSSNIIVNHYYDFSLEYNAITAGACRADDFRIDVALTFGSFSDTPNVLHLCVALGNLGVALRKFMLKVLSLIRFI